MKKAFLSIALGILCSINIFAAADWSGKITDSAGEAVPYANVLLLSPSDSSIIGAATTKEDGSFIIGSTSKKALLRAAMIGYETVTVTAQDKLTIILKEDRAVLGEATVSAVMPKTKLTGEGLQTNIRGSVLENAGNANDVLSKTPGMLKGKDGLEVIGKGSPVYYINGHKVSDSSELERLLSSDIQSIEVINNPGAQYDASVKSVVRIKTIRRQGEGFGFNVNLKDEQTLDNPPVPNPADRESASNNVYTKLNLNYRKKDVDIFGGFDFSNFDSRQESDKLWQRSLGPIESIQDGSIICQYEMTKLSANGGVNWQINSKHSVGFKVDWSQYTRIDGYQLMKEKFLVNNVVTDDLEAKGVYKNNDTPPRSLTANAYYNGTVGQLGIDFNFDWYKLHNGEFSHTTETSSMKEGSDITTNNDSYSDLYAAKLVFSHPIWQGQLQVGTEETFSRMNDDYSITGAQTIPASNSKVKEDNYSLFASYGFLLQKVGQFSAGVRYEHVAYSYDDILNPGNNFTKNYNNVFPSVSYAGQFKDVQAMLNFSVKTNRPSFGNLSDAIRYNSRYVLQSGNSKLQPAISYTAGATTVWKFLAFILNYTRTDDLIASWSRKYNDQGVVLVKPRNLEDPFRQLSFYVNASPTIGVWTMNYTLGIQGQWLKIDTPDPFDETKIRRLTFNDKPMAFANLFNTFRFKYDWQLEAGAEFHTKAYVQNVEVTNNYLDLSLGVQKSLLKDKSLVIRLQGKNLANLGYYNVHADFGSHEIIQDTVMDTRLIELSIKYKFNTANSKYKGTGAGKDVMSRFNTGK